MILYVGNIEKYMRTRNPKRKDRWYLPPNHPLNRFGYVYNRGGIAYLRIGQSRKTTNIPFIESSKELVFSLLIEFIHQKKFASQTKIATLSAGVTLFFTIHQNLSLVRVQSIKHSIKSLIKQDFFLNESDKIRNHIIENINHLTKTLNRKPSTMNKHTSNLFQFFAFLHSEGYIDKNPISKNLMNIKEQEAEILTYTQQELQSIFEYFTDLDYKHFFQFMYITGVRISEAISLEWSDITENYIDIKGKGNIQRVIPIKPFKDLQLLLESMQLAKTSTKKVFQRSKRQYTRALKECLESLGIYEHRKNSHSFRKTRENELIHNQNFTTKVIAELLGHSESIQKKHYLKVLKGEELSQKLLREMEKNDYYAHQKHTENVN